MEKSTPLAINIASRGGSSKRKECPHNLQTILDVPSRDSNVISFLTLLVVSITSKHYKLQIWKQQSSKSLKDIYIKMIEIN